MAESESSVASQWRDRVRGREALIAFFAIEIAAFPLLLVFGRHAWFTQDDWDFLSARTAGDLGDWFRGHFNHLTTLPILVYRLFWVLFGVHTYVPYLALVILLHLVAAALLWALIRRTGARPWLATLLAGGFVFFGAGGENILVAFQITFVGSLVFGFTHLLLADHDGPIDRRDWLGLLAGFAGLLCSGVSIALTIVVGLAVLFRRGLRGWPVALFHTAPIGFAYLLWTAFAPKGQIVANLRSHSPVQIAKFTGVGLQATFSALGRIPGVGIALAALLVVGLVVAFRARRPSSPFFGDGRAVPAALIAGAVLFLIMTGITRAGEGGLLGLLPNSGPDRARESRYIYLIAAMLLPAIGLAAETLMRRRRLLVVPIIALLVVGLPANAQELSGYSPRYATPRGTRYAILTLPRLPLSQQLRNTRVPYPDHRLSAEGLTLGWLVDSADGIPDPGQPDPVSEATVLLQFMVQPTSNPAAAAVCTPLTKAVIHVIDKGETFSIERGSAFVRYIPEGSAPSLRRPFLPDNYSPVVGPLRLLFVPLDEGVDLCV